VHGDSSADVSAPSPHVSLAAKVETAMSTLHWPLTVNGAKGERLQAGSLYASLPTHTNKQMHKC